MTIAADRRSVLKMGLAAGAALAAPQLMVRAAQARTPLSQVGNPGFNRFRLGAFEITAINDGTRPGDGIHTIFGVDRDEAEVSALLEENFLPADRFVNSFTPALVNTALTSSCSTPASGPARARAVSASCGRGWKPRATRRATSRPSS